VEVVESMVVQSFVVGSKFEEQGHFGTAIFLLGSVFCHCHHHHHQIKVVQPGMDNLDLKLHIGNSQRVQESVPNS
jgi:hypothetical protein